MTNSDRGGSQEKTSELVSEMNTSLSVILLWEEAIA